MSSHIDCRSVALWRSITQGRAAENNPNNEFEIKVIFTDHQGTLAALKTAGTLARQLRARIDLLVPQVVPFALPLTRPPVSLGFSENHFLDLAYQGAQGPLDTFIQLYLCRDRRRCLLEVLKPQSLVVVGARARWWPTEETKLARSLALAGHQVILADSRVGSFTLTF